MKPDPGRRAVLPDPAVFATAHEELERLLAMGQHPSVEALLLREYILLFEEAPRVLWEAFGFRMAFRLAAAVTGDAAGRLFEEDRDRLMRALTLAASFGAVPEQRHATEWDGALERAEQALREAAGGPAAGPDHGSAGDHEGPEEASILIPVVLRPNTGPSGTLPLYAGISVAMVIRLGVGVYPRFQRSGARELAVDGRIDEASRHAMRESLPAVAGFGPPGAPRVDRCLFRLRWSEPAAALTGRGVFLFRLRLPIKSPGPMPRPPTPAALPSAPLLSCAPAAPSLIPSGRTACEAAARAPSPSAAGTAWLHCCVA